MSERKYTALIAGSSGAVGSALAQELASRPSWRVIGLSRRAPLTPVAGVEYVQADMSDADDLSAALQPYGAISHAYYCGRATHAEQIIESAPENVALLVNLLDVLEASSPELAHVHLVQGGKCYGVHIGPFKTPARESHPRAPIENFNYDQEDVLRRRTGNASWTWSASRPNTLLHFSPGVGRNIVSSLGAYAAICKELGASLDFPGPQGAYDSATQLTTLPLLARAMTWVSTKDACGNKTFNVTNTDVIRWNTLWSMLAAHFDVPLGVVRPMRLSNTMATREPTWQTICHRYGLRQTTLAEVCNWGYLDATLERYWDELFSHARIREHGFHEWDDSEARFATLLGEYQNASILP